MSVPDLRGCDRVWTNARIATLDPAVKGPYGALGSHALAVKDEHIAAIIPMTGLEAHRLPREVIDAAGRWITPGLIDCHTHLIYGGNRAGEFELRLSGIGYEEIARRGGGIRATVEATRALSETELVEAALPRLRALVREGVTCVEVKSGYGLTVDHELRMLRAARRLAERAPAEIAPTLLAAHALPPEFDGRPDAYIDHVCSEVIPRAASAGLAEAVDVFCETVGFTPAQCGRVLEAARRHGLAVKGHVEQLSSLGGVELLARHGALSADHLENLSPAGAAALAASGMVAVLLPGSYYCLRQSRKPPVEALRAAGAPMAVATDLNPGTSPLASIRLMMNMACTLFGLTPQEALAGVTREAARALGRLDRLGTLAAGKRADLLVWDIEGPAELSYGFGTDQLRQRVVRGRIEDGERT